MIKELEKKFVYTQDDYEKIVDNCKKEDDEEIKDYYLDNLDLSLFKKNYYLRLRNWVYELKITDKESKNWLIKSEEIVWDDKIDEILKKEFWFSIDETAWVLYVETHRENYSYSLENEKINICIDTFQHWKRYEIEILSDKEEEKIEEIINKFIKTLWLEAISDEEKAWKTIVCARNQNMEIYNIMKG